MNYPPEFSKKARAAIEAEMITSLRLHDERLRQWKSDWSFPERQSLATCILTIFLTYARAAMELGSNGIWGVDKVRTQSLEGLRLITIGVCSKRNYHLFIESGGGSISYESQREFEATPEWREFEDEILALAAREGAGNTELRSPDSQTETGDRTAKENLTAQGPSDLVSWGDLRGAFEECAAEYDNLYAEYDSLYPGKWILGSGSPRSHRKFRDLGGAAAAMLGPSKIEGNGEPWQAWLAHMRAEGWRRPELPSPDASAPRGGRLPWHILKRMLERDDRTIWHVFQTSADCCRDFEEREQVKKTTEPTEKSSSTLRAMQVPELVTTTAVEDAPPGECEIAETAPVANAPPAQTISPQFAPTRRGVGSLAVFTDPRYPPPDIWEEAYPLIKEALQAWGFEGREPENAFWNRWLEQCNWHGETNFLLASIKHCKIFAGHLLGEGRNQDAAVFARVAVGLEKLKAKVDGRLEDLLAQQVEPEGPVKPIDTQASELNESAPEDRLKQFIAHHPGTTYADVGYSAKVHKPDFQSWRKNELKPTSVMALRVEAVLNGQTPLQKKPPKQRPD